MMGALSGACCTDARLYSLRIKIGTRTSGPRMLALLNSPQEYHCNIIIPLLLNIFNLFIKATDRYVFKYFLSREFLMCCWNKILLSPLGA